jgi:hypothetical protein
MIRFTLEGDAVKVQSDEVIESDFLRELLFPNGKFVGQKAADLLFRQALLLGVRAIQLDNTSVLLNAMEKDLFGRVSELRLLYQVREKAEKSSAVGAVAEAEIDDVLQALAKEFTYNDIVRKTGNNASDGLVKSKGDRKLGDIEILVDGSDLKIAVESKYTGTGPAMGDLLESGNNLRITIDNHAKGQVRGAQANRGSTFAIFVTKKDSAVHKKMKQDVYLDLSDFAIYAAIDRSTGDFASLKIAYLLARGLTRAQNWPMVEAKHLRNIAGMLAIATTRITNSRSRLEDISSSALSIRDAAESLVADFENEFVHLGKVKEFTEAVFSGDQREELDLLITEIELITGEVLEKKPKKSS